MKLCWRSAKFARSHENDVFFSSLFMQSKAAANHKTGSALLTLLSDKHRQINGFYLGLFEGFWHTLNECI